MSIICISVLSFGCGKAVNADILSQHPPYYEEIAEGWLSAPEPFADLTTDDLARVDIYSFEAARFEELPNTTPVSTELSRDEISELVDILKGYRVNEDKNRVYLKFLKYPVYRAFRLTYTDGRALDVSVLYPYIIFNENPDNSNKLSSEKFKSYYCYRLDGIESADTLSYQDFASALAYKYFPEHTDTDYSKEVA